MSISGTIKIEASLPGLKQTTSLVRTAAGSIGAIDTQLAAAKTGRLTTRTSNTEGTLTMDSGHGITDGAIIAIFSATSCSYLATVGTVSTNSVPFSGAAGDNLPADETDVTVQVMTPYDVDFDGDKLELFAAMATARCVAVFEDEADDVICAAEILEGEALVFATDAGMVNPLAGDAIDQVWLANADSVNVCDFRMGGVYNSDT